MRTVVWDWEGGRDGEVSATRREREREARRQKGTEVYNGYSLDGKL